MPLLATNCTLASGVLTVTVKDGESAYLTLRTDDGYVIVNANMAPNGGAGSGAGTGASGMSGSSGSAGSSGSSGSSGMSGSNLQQCAVAPSGTIQIKSDTNGAVALGRSVILDYIDGIFMKSPSTAVTGIKIDFTLPGDNNGAKNALKVRGSQGNDSFAFGAGTAMGGAALNINATITTGGAGSGGSAGTSGSGAANAGTDAIPDVIFNHVMQVMIAGGLGNDRIDASGRTSAGVGTLYTTTVQLFGNAGDDTIVGGSGDDLIVGGIGNDVLQGCAGNDTYDMGPSAAGSDIIAQNCTSNNEGADILDYSKRTGDVTLNPSTTIAAASNPAMDVGMTSGELTASPTPEASRISDNIATIKMGAGNDIINIAATSAIKHYIYGGAGDDVYTGGTVTADTFDGEGGDDTCIGNLATMDYSASTRTNGVTVSVCTPSGNPAVCTAADANDGDQTGTVTKTGTGASTVATNGTTPYYTTTLTGTGFTAASLGNLLDLANCGTSGNNSNNNKIVQVTGTTTVKVQVPSSYAGMDTCDYTEHLPDGTTNAGTMAATTDKAEAAQVTISSTQPRPSSKTITLLHTSTSMKTGANAADEDGTFKIFDVLGSSSPNNKVLVIDASAQSTFGTNTNLGWTITGPESDSVGCAHVIGTKQADTITGDGRNNTIKAGLGDDIINGGAGNDNLQGDYGMDQLYGGPDDDKLFGGPGADTLVGGDGNDVLEGDSEADTFICDGHNTNTATMDGTNPGDSDFKVDYTPSGPNADVALGSMSGCEF